MKLKISLLLFVLLFLGGCHKKSINVITDVDDFDVLITTEKVLNYDMRLYSECEEGHIPGFMCFGPDIVEDYQMKIDKLVQGIVLLHTDKDQKIVVITSDDRYALNMLQALEVEGYTALYYYRGGYHQYVKDKQDNYIPETGCNCE
ncbi:MAG: rhodanese-like domain-containing protein [Bacilli bacterium]|jgi:rhodanese-related sulfurtransferase|nr:rhodanese-like domain-containing protein [Bacilli bacterium]MDD4056200.1 rhodanese-like domain-containing protein [Bacilli bacterium]MDY0208816.1 rhodanese-like domain-containing protein [Bacilli bacterium]